MAGNMECERTADSVLFERSKLGIKKSGKLRRVANHPINSSATIVPIALLSPSRSSSSSC
jgi:hypothetical protein